MQRYYTFLMNPADYCVVRFYCRKNIVFFGGRGGDCVKKIDNYWHGENMMAILESEMELTKLRHCATRALAFIF